MPPSQLPRLQIAVDRDAGGVVVRLVGELDAATAGQLERALIRMAAPTPVLVLDLHRLSFVDSLGLNMLFRAREWAQTRGVAMRVVRGPVHVQRLIALAAPGGTFGPFYADADAALRV